jgi:hypothetical protein
MSYANISLGAQRSCNKFVIIKYQELQHQIQRFYYFKDILKLEMKTIGLILLLDLWMFNRSLIFCTLRSINVLMNVVRMITDERRLKFLNSSTARYRPGSRYWARSLLGLGLDYFLSCIGQHAIFPLVL